MKVPQDRQPPARRGFDVRGRKQERLSTYFDIENADLNVKRYELQAILDRIEQVREARTSRGFLRRVWRFLKRPLGSPPAIVAPTSGEIARGEVDS